MPKFPCVCFLGWFVCVCVLCDLIMPALKDLYCSSLALNTQCHKN